MRKIDWGEIVAAAGVVIGVVGQGLWLAQSTRPIGEGVRVIGLSVFLAGVVLSLREISKRLGELKQIQSLSATTIALSEANRVSRREPKSIHLRATTDVLSYLISDYVPKLTEKLREFASNPSFSIEVADHSPIHDLMYRLGVSLPTGSLWFGITLLESVDAWNHPGESRFGRFKNIMRKRSKSGELGVLRVYYFQHDSTYESMVPEMLREVENGIQVRVIRGGKPPPDISLLYAPKRRRITKIAQVESTDPIASLKQKGYQPLCALGYDAVAGALLTRLSIFPGESTEFVDLESAFAHEWNRAAPLQPRKA